MIIGCLLPSNWINCSWFLPTDQRISKTRSKRLWKYIVRPIRDTSKIIFHNVTLSMYEINTIYRINVQKQKHPANSAKNLIISLLNSNRPLTWLEQPFTSWSTLKKQNITALHFLSLTKEWAVRIHLIRLAIHPPFEGILTADYTSRNMLQSFPAAVDKGDDYRLSPAFKLNKLLHIK